MKETNYDGNGNQIIDISDFAFIYNNVVSFVNNVCLDMDVIGRLNYLRANKLVTDDKKELFHFIERRTYLSLVVTLDAIIDDPNADREDGNKIKNNGINLIKLLNIAFDIARQTKNKKDKEEAMNFVKELIKIHTDLQHIEERKKIGTFRDRLAAHVDVAFVKDEKYEDFDMGNEQFIKIMNPVLKILINLSKFVNVSEGEPLKEISPYNPKRATPIDNLFGS